MSTSRLYSVNQVWGASATASASGTAAGFTPNSVFSTKRTLIWRSTTTTGDQWIEIDFAGSVALDGMFATDFKIHSGGKMTPQYWTGSAWANFGGDFTIPASNRTKLVSQFASHSTTKVRIYFTNTATASDYVEAGIVWAGNSSIPTQNVQPGVTIDSLDPSIKKMTVGGQCQFWKRPSYLSASVVYRPLTTTDRDLILQVFDGVGAHSPAIFAIDPSNVDLTIYGTFVDKVEAQHIAGVVWAIPVDFQELR
jgi:hypothetical protein